MKAWGLRCWLLTSFRPSRLLRLWIRACLYAWIVIVNSIFQLCNKALVIELHTVIPNRNLSKTNYARLHNTRWLRKPTEHDKWVWGCSIFIQTHKVRCSRVSLFNSFLNIIMAAVTKKKVVVVAGMFCLLTRCFRLSQVFEQASEIVLGLEQLLCEFMWPRIYLFKKRLMSHNLVEHSTRRAMMLLLSEELLKISPNWKKRLRRLEETYVIFRCSLAISSFSSKGARFPHRELLWRTTWVYMAWNPTQFLKWQVRHHSCHMEHCTWGLETFPRYHTRRSKRIFAD